jgi:hypothetical protein
LKNDCQLELSEILEWKVERIQKFVSGLLPREQKIWIQILKELAVGDDSPTYEEIWRADYREIMPDWDTFIDDPRYLGNATNKGKGVYDAWREYGRQVLRPGSGVVECILTGATRIGKSTCGCLIGAYELMRLMCMRKPQLLFGLLPDSSLTFFFFNITKDLAKDVTFRQFNDMLLSSPWFNSHGTWSKSEEAPVYKPGCNNINIKAGSAAVGGRHGLGQQVFFACLKGDTEIYTDDGVVRLEDVVGKTVNVLQYNEETGDTYYVSAPVLQTGVTRETIKITLENGSYFEGTPNHKVMLKDGTYKELQDLTEDDELMVTEKPDTSWLVYVQGGRKTGIQEIKHVFYPEPIPVYDVCNAVPRHNFVVHSNGVGIVEHNCMDEVNFETGAVKDVRAAKTKMLDCYNTLYTRITGTFSLNGECWGKMVALSSKKDTCDFIEAHVENKEKSGATDFLKFDKPQWEVLPPKRFWKEKEDGTFDTDDRCCVAVATRTLPGLILPKEQDTPEARSALLLQGYELIFPPESLRKNFEMDYDVALIDQAGISRIGVRTFITAQLLERNYTDRVNAFSLPVIEIGTKDDYRIEEYFDINCIAPADRGKPLAIHLDLSINRDKTGISGTARTGVTEVRSVRIENGKEISDVRRAPIHKQWFGTSLRAPNGAHIPYEKIRRFLLWLRDEKKFNIVKITSDGFESEYMHQLLQADGFDTEKRSLDRTKTGYTRLRDALVEGTFEPLRIPLQDKELCELYWTGRKWDHPHSGCFTAETMVKTTVASKSMRQLYEEHLQGIGNWTYSYKDGVFVRAKITNAFITKLVDELMQITLNTGEVIECTPDHRFMLVDGTYKEACRLTESDELMTVHNNISKKNFMKTISNCSIKIKSLSRLRVQDIPVFDLTVEETSNFTLHAGEIIVHNSKDLADGCAGSHWAISEMEFEDAESIANALTAGYKKYTDKLSASNGTDISQFFDFSSPIPRRGVRPRKWI